MIRSPMTACDVYSQIAHLLEPHWLPVGPADRPCPTCGGTGEVTLQRRWIEVDGNVEWGPWGVQVCWCCGGAGLLPTRRESRR